jgi:transposase
MNTTLHAVTDEKGRPISFFMTAGQVSDCTGPAVAQWIAQSRVAAGRPGYDAGWFRDALDEKGITPCIPGRKFRKTTVKYD